MRYCHFVHNDERHYGLVESVAGVDTITRIFSVARSESGLPDEDAPTSRIAPVAFAEAKLLAPCAPSKIICVGRNYREHAVELGHEIPTKLLIFSKPPSAIINPGDAIRRPGWVSKRMDYEGELAVIIGRQCHKLKSSDDVRPYIHGYTCLNDVTARDLQDPDNQWTRAKGFDTFCPLGPIVSDEINPWEGVTVETRVNGEVRQHGTTKDFIFPLGDVIRYIASVMTLLPGDVIATGTPKGVGPIVAGDVVEVEVQGVGVLRNSVVEDDFQP